MNKALEYQLNAFSKRLVVLAAGISSRMKLPVKDEFNANHELMRHAEERSKGMIGVGRHGRPFLDYLLFNARASHIDDVVIVIGEHDEHLRNHYGSQDRGNEFHGLSISYAVQKIPRGRKKPLGTADALLQGLHSRPDWNDKDFVVCNSDNLYSTNAMKLLRTCGDSNAMIDYDRSSLGFDDERISRFGITRKDPNGYLLEIVEKPSIWELEQLRGRDGTLRVSMNIFRLNYVMVLPFLEACPLQPVRQEKELVTALTSMVTTYPRSLRAIPLREHVPDLTYKDDIAQIQKYLAEHYGELDWKSGIDD